MTRYNTINHLTWKATDPLVEYLQRRLCLHTFGHSGPYKRSNILQQDCRTYATMLQCVACVWLSLKNKNIYVFTSKSMWLIETMSLLSGSFAYVDKSYKARLESSLLPWKPFHQSVGVCLRFSYLMPTKSKSNLKVFLRDTKREISVLVWQMVGYHGKEWSDAQVAWPGAVGIKVREQFRFHVSFKALGVNSFWNECH